MSYLRSLLCLCLLLPAIAYGQAIHQEKVGFYIANKAGSDCSQATLVAADAAALTAGQILAIPPVDRFGAACQWVISSNTTLVSPVFFPYNPVPVLQVAAGVTLTLAECPVIWGDYFIIDANETTTGTVAYSAGCQQCGITGPNSWTRCLTAGVAERVVDGADSVANAFVVKDGNDGTRLYTGVGGPLIECFLGASPCDIVDDIPTGQSYIMKGAGVTFETVTDLGVHAYLGPAKPRKSVYFPALALEVDGTNCVYAAALQLNSGPQVTPLRCADSASSVFEGNISMLGSGWDGGPLRFSLHVHHGTTESIVFAGDWSAMCRGDSDGINNTWGTPVQGDVSIDTAHDLEQQMSADVTPNGTCAPGDHIFFRFVVDDVTFPANAANVNVLGVSMHFLQSTRNGDDE